MLRGREQSPTKADNHASYNVIDFRRWIKRTSRDNSNKPTNGCKI
jgi:hypothetical protein